MRAPTPALRLFLATALLALVAVLAAPASPGKAQDTSTAFQCGPDPATQALLALTSQQDWSAWIERLSGAQAVTLDGETTRILTRYSPSLFSGAPNARAFDYVFAQVSAWYPVERIEVDPFAYDGQTWKNLIVTLPGASRPDEIVILSAHLDSTSEDPTVRAPGASDNASGAAALLEAARIMRHFRFERTLRIIFFTGEEQGLIGSRAYVQDHDVTGVQGVINLDMFGFDRDEDACFELHVGTLAASAPVGACFAEAMQAYQPNLRVDYLNGLDMAFSDHAAFWEAGIGAVEVLENFMYNGTENGCQGIRDTNPAYHTSGDTIDKLNLEAGFAIARTALAAAAGMAAPEEACFAAAPTLARESASRAIGLQWQSVSGAQAYRVYRSIEGCSRGWEQIAATDGLSWSDQSANAGRLYSYRVEAVAAQAACVSLPSPCLQASLRPAFRGAPFEKE